MLDVRLNLAKAVEYRFTPTDPHVYSFVPPPEAPVFEPTMEEFENPLNYIEKIKEKAEGYGICRIKTPPEWEPPFAVNLDTFKFKPRIQRIHELEARTRIKLDFVAKIKKFWHLQGTRFCHPVIDNKCVDLYLLYHYVKREGGFLACSKHWSKIARLLKYSGDIQHTKPLTEHYRQWLWAYEIFEEKIQRKALGRAFTRPVTAAGPEKKPNVAPSTSTLSQVKSNAAVPAKKMKVGEKMKSNRTVVESDALKKGHCEPQIYTESRKQSASNRKSAQHKKKIEQDPLAKYMCLCCGGGDREESMLLCDGCDDSYHIFCLTPKMDAVPKGDWNCPKCIEKEFNKPKELFGFVTSQKECSIKEFGVKAERFKTDYFGKLINSANDALIPERLVEQEYWRILSDMTSKVVVEYGADIHSLEYGSGFPSRRHLGHHKDPETPKYLVSPWNLNNLPVLRRSLLSFIKDEIPGMKVPWMYVGMCFSTFCWHNEDHWSYSINYLHWGEAKTWYGVPGACAEKFEEIMRLAAPELFEKQPDLLHELTTTLNPNVLMFAGVPVYRTDQQAGEFVVTFPRAYHAGFNQGYNFAEAVNFTPLDWLPLGRKCVEDYSKQKRQLVFSQDELIVNIALLCKSVDPVIAAAVYDDYVDMLNDEAERRDALQKWGLSDVDSCAFEEFPDDERQCFYCKTTIYLSAVVCKCSGTKLACLRHFKELCQCPAADHTLKYNFDMIDLPLLGLSLRAVATGKEEDFQAELNA